MIYLDNNATTRPADEVTTAVHEALTRWWGNPSSIHRFGQQIRQQVELARQQVCQLLGCKERELIFTSGATESNNLALRGLLETRRPRQVVITTAVEHSAVREPTQRLAEQGIEVIRPPVSLDGLVDVEALEGVIEQRADEIALVSVHWINNETGAIQPIERIGRACREHRIPFHTDATQAVGKMALDVSELPIDALSFSAHKFHGPKGVGGLYVRSRQRLRPQTLGGPHERERRGGTENVPGILGLGAAARLAAQFLQSDQPARLQAMRDKLESGITDAIPDARVNAGGAARLWNTTNIGFPGLESEAILLLLSEKGICAAAGAACSSGSLEPSPILLAMGVPEPVAHGSIRLSLSRETTREQIDQAIEMIPEALRKLRATMPV